MALSGDGSRREITFGELSERSARLAGALLERGVAQGDVVMTVIGNRPEWVEAMVACFRIGAVALPCTEQLRPKDLRARMDLRRAARRGRGRARRRRRPRGRLRRARS